MLRNLIGAGLACLAVAGCAREGPRGLGGSVVAPLASTSGPGVRLDALEVLPPGEIRIAGDGRGTWLSQQLVVNGFFTDGSSRDVTAETTFTVADPSVARVSRDGLVTVVGRGSTRLTVSLRAANGAVLRAERAIVADDSRGLPGRNGSTPSRLELYPSSRALAHVDSRAGRDQVQQLVAVLVYQDGAREDVTRSVPFVALDPTTAGGVRGRSDAASISSSGVLRAIRDGATVDVRAGISARDLVAGSRFVLGRAHGPIGTADLYLGDPLAGSTNPLDVAALAVMRQRGVEPSPLAGDGEFLRRLTADLLGRLPTGSELTAFEQDSAPDKRQRTIDRLLATDEFAMHWAANVIAPWVGVAGGGFEAAVKDDLRAGMTLGTILRRISAGSGNPLNELPERAAFDASFNVNIGREGPSRLMMAFTGMSVRCGMCHDHKLSPPWGHVRSQKLFSFFAPDLNAAKLTDGTTDYGNPIEPDWDLGPIGRPLPVLGSDPSRTLYERRARFAELLAETDAFQRGTAHRIWTELGTPLLDPNRVLETSPQAVLQPAVLQALTGVFRNAQGSLQEFLRVVLASRLYQLTTEGVSRHKDPLLARQTLRRHHAETLDKGTSSVTGDPVPFAASGFFLNNFGYPFARLLPMFPRSHAINTAQPLTLQSSSVVHEKVTRLGNGISDLARDVNMGQITYEEAVRRIVRSALSRDPTAAEVTAIVSLTRGGNVPTLVALEDVASAVMSSTEFVLR